MALTSGRFDTARSFNLPVRQLEGQTRRAGRERRGVLGRRVGSYATWLTIVCLHFEVVLLLVARPPDAALPAGERRLEARRTSSTRVLAGEHLLTTATSLAYARRGAAARAVLRRRRASRSTSTGARCSRAGTSRWRCASITQRHAAAAVMLCCVLLHDSPMLCLRSGTKNPRREIAEVLKAKEFPHQVDTTQLAAPRPARSRRPASERRRRRAGSAPRLRARQCRARCCSGLLAVAAVAYAIWWAARMLPRDARAGARSLSSARVAVRHGARAREAAAPTSPRPRWRSRATASLREALGLLYRGALSDLVHRRGVELLASHTELEALQLATRRVDPERSAYLQTLVRVWRAVRLRARDRRRSPKSSSLAAGYRRDGRMRTAPHRRRRAARLAVGALVLVERDVRARAGQDLGRPDRRGAAAPVPRRRALRRAHGPAAKRAALAARRRRARAGGVLLMPSRRQPLDPRRMDRDRSPGCRTAATSIAEAEAHRRLRPAARPARRCAASTRPGSRNPLAVPIADGASCNVALRSRVALEPPTGRLLIRAASGDSVRLASFSRGRGVVTRDARASTSRATSRSATRTMPSSCGG